MKALLAIRALFFVALLPGVLAGYVPYQMLLGSGRLHLPAFNATSVASCLLILVGVTVHLRCVWDFFARGKGTLAPIDPPRYLVVSGLYRYTRNPMYNGVVAVLLGQAWLFGSMAVLTYALFLFVAFHLFVVLYEEPVLESQFHESYVAYRRAVPRWGFRPAPQLWSAHDERSGAVARFKVSCSNASGGMLPKELWGRTAL